MYCGFLLLGGMAGMLLDPHCSIVDLRIWRTVPRTAPVTSLPGHGGVLGVPLKAVTKVGVAWG
jgi:hypothetical protein